MEEDTEIPAILASDQLTRSREYIVESSKRVNEASADYRSITSSIHDRIILLSGGSISLLLTFLGILIGQNQKASHLPYGFLYASAVLFLATITLLLAAKWLQALYVFKANHQHYLEDRSLENQANLQVARSSPDQILDQTTGRRMTVAARNTLISNIRDTQNKIEDKIKEDKRRAKLSLKLSKRLPIAAYLFLIAAYVAASIFFLTVTGI